MALADPIQTALDVADAFARLAIPYVGGGSIASSLHGMPRSTHDVDLLAALRLPDVDRLAAALDATFFVDEESAREAVRTGSSFNLIHRTTCLKVDVFPLRDEDFARSQMDRRAPLELVPESGLTVFVTTAEDTVLQKLLWYRKGGEVSDLQWKDVLGVLKVQGEALDFGYLRSWAPRIGVADLLARAFDDAGIDPSRVG